MPWGRPRPQTGPSCGRTPWSTRSCWTASATATASNDRPVVADSLLAPANYPGGDLQGLLDAIEAGYFTGLGVNTLWLSPLYDNPPGAEREYSRPAPLLHRLPRLLAELARARWTSTSATWRYSGVTVDGRARARPARAAGRRRPPRPRLAPVRQQHPEWFGALELPDGSLNLRRWDEYRLTTWFEPYLPTFDFERAPAAVRRSPTTPCGGCARPAPTASVTTP